MSQGKAGEAASAGSDPGAGSASARFDSCDAGLFSAG